MIQRFFTAAGVEVPAITAGQMREVDRIAIEETGPNLFQMMENAGRNLAEFALEVLQGSKGKRIVVIAGVGGNGGGGICAARHLANHGVDVDLCVTEPIRLTEISAWQRKVFQATPGREIEARELTLRKPDLILDAILGYSLNGAPRGAAADLIEWANRSGAPIVSLDAPSGVDSTTGETPGLYIRPERTMTLALPKTGLTPERTGMLVLADIGIPQGTYDRIGLVFHCPFEHRYREPLSV